MTHQITTLQKHTSFIHRVEKGEFYTDNKADIKALQELVDTGTIWGMSRPWQRFAQTMIELKLISVKRDAA